MMKLSFEMLFLIVILISTSIYAKGNGYYELETKECRIALPLGYDIMDGFTENRIAFIQQKNFLEINTITLYKGCYEQKINWLKNELKKDQITLIEEKKIGHLLYLKFNVPLSKNISQYQYYIFGKSFFYDGSNVDQKDIDHMIKHCNETYNEDNNTSK